MDHRGTDPSAITNPPADNSTEWTILYYGAGNYPGDVILDGQSQTVATVHGLQDVYATDKVHAVALVSTAADDGQCRFYDINFRPGESGNQISSVAKDWGQRDMSSPDLLKQFVDSAAALYPAQHYALVIGGQGEAWRGACRDDAGGGRVMPMPAISQSLNASTSQNGLPVHFDVLLWLTPGMNTMEVAYEMRGKADYMVATSSILPQPGFLACDEWLRDLCADPTQNGERLGRFMVARMTERATAAHDTLATFNLVDVRSLGALAQDISDLADSMTTILHGHSARILQIWQSLWDAQASDSSAIDLPAFVDAIRADSVFYSVAGVHQTADLVQSAISQVLVDRRSTRQGSLRQGLAIYSPIVPSPTDMQTYNSLRMSQDEPGWANLLVAMQQSGSSLVQIHGTVKWAGHNLQDPLHPLYVFLNSAQVGQALVSLIAPATLTTGARQDSVEFQASFALDGDSASAYLGTFQDISIDQQLSAGDQFGYYHRHSTLHDWLTIHSGDTIDSVFITLTAQQH